MLKTVIAFLVCLSYFNLHGQNAFRSIELYSGINSGVNPNFNNEHNSLNFFSGIQSSLSVKGLPFKLSAQYSNEPLRSGNPSFLRFSYDYQNDRIQRINELKKEVSDLKTNIDSLNTKLFALEKSFAAQRYLKSRIPNIENYLESTISKYRNDYSDIEWSDILNNYQDSLSFSQLNFVSELEKKELLRILHYNDSMQGVITAYKDTQFSSDEIDALKSKINNKKNLMSSLQSSLTNLERGIRAPGYNLKRIDIGLTALPSGGESMGLPVHGFSHSGTFNHLFYEIGAGASVRTVLNANSVLDQLLANQQTTFNWMDFNAFNTSRLVSSSFFGIGDQEKNFIAVGHSHSGRTFSEFREQVSEASNTSLNLKFGVEPLDLIQFSGFLGTTLNNQGFFQESSLLDLGINFSSPSGKNMIQTKFKHVGLAYDNFPQGFVNNGYNTISVNLTSDLHKTLKFQTSFSQNTVHARGDTLTGFEVQNIGSRIYFKPFEGFVAHGGISLARANRLANPTTEPLINCGVNFNRLIRKKINYISSFNFDHVLMNQFNDLIQIQQMRFYNALTWNKFVASISYDQLQYSGLERISGNHNIATAGIDMNLEIKKVQASINLSYKFGQSQQFGIQHGGSFGLIMRFLEKYTLNLNIQKWLDSETAFFVSNQSDLLPVFAECKLSILMNYDKKN